MAVCSTIQCIACKQEKHVYHSASTFAPSICTACKQDAENSKRKADLDAIARQPLEERLRRIEAFMYDHQKIQHGWQPEPRF